MKKLIIALIFGLMLVPLSALGQKWIPPYTDKDGSFVEGHWQTQEELRKEQSMTPGSVNPYTGHFTPYSPGVQPPPRVTPTPQAPLYLNPYYPPLNPYYPPPDYRYYQR
jgi:hypothetical protein